MREWAHHHRTDTVDDPVFRAAMRGCDSVSFVFSLEVTWSKIQKRQQEEEDQKALEELRVLQELHEGNEEDGVDTDEIQDVVQIEETDGHVENNENVVTRNQEVTIAMEAQDLEIELEDNVDTKKCRKAALCEGATVLMEQNSSGGGSFDPSDKCAVLLVDSSNDEDPSEEVASEVGINDDVEVMAASMGESTDGSDVGSSSETPSSSVSSPERSVDESSPVAKADLNHWDCGKCTYTNSISKRKCNVCKTSRPKTGESEQTKSPGRKRSRWSH
jgi:hypothetical protein